MERKDGSEAGAVERAVLEHAAIVRARCGGATEWVRALQGSVRKWRVRAEYFIFFSSTVCCAVQPASWPTNGGVRQILSDPTL